MAEVSPALNAYRPQRHPFDTISMAELEARQQKGEAALLDVRPEDEYKAGHLPHAISIPISKLPARVAELPTDRLIVAYCRGPYCVYADQALALLQESGRRGARLEEGVNEWRQLGKIVEFRS